MKITPTADGGLHIATEDAADWMLLSGITNDALTRKGKLSHRLGERITNAVAAEDWLDYIAPEIEAGFSASVLHVTTAIATARVDSGGAIGSLIIPRSESLHWYSALNQARLSLEDTHKFGPNEDIKADLLPPKRRAAFLRSQFYSAIQSMLLTVGLD